MGIEIERRTLSFTEVSGQGMAEVNVQRSVALPGQYPAMKQAVAEPVLWANGTAVVTSVEAGDGCIKVAGHIASSVVYLPETDGESILIDLAEPGFEASVDVPGVKPDDWAEAVATLIYVHAEPAGARGMMLSASLTVTARASRSHSLDVAVSAVPNGQSRISVRNEDVLVVSHLFIEPQTAVLDETMGDADQIYVGQRCGAAASAKVINCEVHDGKITVNCEVAMEAACIQRGGQCVDILRKDRLPLLATIEVPQAKRGMAARADVQVEKVSAEADIEGEIHVIIETAVRATLISSERASVVSAIQSETSEIVDAETVWIIAERVAAESAMQIDIADSVPLQAIAGARAPGPMEEIRSSHGNVGVTGIEALEGEAALRGLLAVRVIVEDIQEDEEGEFRSSRAMDVPVEFSDTVEIQGLSGGDRVEVRGVSHALVAERVGSSKLDVEGTVRFDLVAYKQQKAAVVASAYTITPVKLDPYSLTFCVVSPSDTLTRIARKYGVSPELIAQANSIGVNDLLTPGQKLYIPAQR